MKKMGYYFLGVLAAFYRVGDHAIGNETCLSGIDLTDLHRHLPACRDLELFTPKHSKVRNPAKTVVFFSDEHGDLELGKKLLSCSTAIAKQVTTASLLELTEDKLALTKDKALKSWDDAKSSENMVRLYLHHRLLIQLKTLEDAYYRAKASDPVIDKSFLHYLKHMPPVMADLNLATSNYPAIQKVPPIKNQLIDCFRRSGSFRYCFRSLRTLHAQFAPLTGNKKNYQKLFKDDFHDLLWLIQIQPHNAIRNRALIQSINRFIQSNQSTLFIYGGGRHFRSEQLDNPLHKPRFDEMQKETNGSLLDGKQLGEDQSMLLRYHKTLSPAALKLFLFSSEHRTPLSDEFSWVPAGPRTT